MIDAGLIAQATMRNRQRQRRAHGAQAESIIPARLRALGFHLVERVHTPWQIMRGVNGRITSAFPLEKVSGDFRCVAPGGRSVLVEVKSRSRRLPYSAVERHQALALDQHYLAGGMSLLAWVSPEGVVILDYPRLDLQPRQSLTWAEAIRHHARVDR
ncbi:MAG: hypothetical protein H0W48_00625 [Methylibium sp.]|nr:hypothetical protein [Methylibium sp.]